MKTPQVLSLGSSNMSWEAFYRLLELSGADAIIDVRARPYSRWPHFNGDEMKARANFHGLPYRFLGHQLGGLPEGDCRAYRDVAETQEFKDGIAKVLEIAGRCRPVLICAEHDPLTCHRFLLIARRLAAEGAQVEHILRHGEIETQRETEVRMLKANRLHAEDLWTPFPEILNRAYERQERRIRRLK